jgi:hypothetical protein
MKEKRCSTYGKSKWVGLFNRNGKTADGRFAECRQCQDARARRWRRNNQGAPTAPNSGSWGHRQF